MKLRTFLSIGLFFLCVEGCTNERVVPLPSVSSAEDSGAGRVDAKEWEYFGTFGTNQGPFRDVGDIVLNAGADKKRIWFTIDGTRTEKDLSDINSEALVQCFENPNGDSMAIVYVRRSSRE